MMSEHSYSKVTILRSLPGLAVPTIVIRICVLTVTNVTTLTGYNKVLREAANSMNRLLSDDLYHIPCLLESRKRLNSARQEKVCGMKLGKREKDR